MASLDKNLNQRPSNDDHETQMFYQDEIPVPNAPYLRPQQPLRDFCPEQIFTWKSACSIYQNNIDSLKQYQHYINQHQSTFNMQNKNEDFNSALQSNMHQTESSDIIQKEDETLKNQSSNGIQYMLQQQMKLREQNNQILGQLYEKAHSLDKQQLNKVIEILKSLQSIYPSGAHENSKEICGTKNINERSEVGGNKNQSLNFKKSIEDLNYTYDSYFEIEDTKQASSQNQEIKKVRQEPQNSKNINYVSNQQNFVQNNY